MYAHTHTHARTRMHTCTLTHAHHAHTHTHTHTPHTHAHTLTGRELVQQLVSEYLFPASRMILESYEPEAAGIVSINPM